jgi:PIN domain nuclease of toxin-antitoxin system
VIVLDTHAWYWWTTQPAQLSQKARDAITANGGFAISAISCWEMAMLVRKGRVRFDRDVSVWIRQSLALPEVDAIPVSAEIATAAGLLEIHGDPADRIIVATAQHVSASLITKDRTLRRNTLIQTIW